MTQRLSSRRHFAHFGLLVLLFASTCPAEDSLSTPHNTNPPKHPSSSNAGIENTGVTNYIDATKTRIYKIVNPDGSISYSDKADINAEELIVKPISTVPALVIKQNQTILSQDTNQSDYYQALNIISPEPNSAFHSGSGNITVKVQIKPKLRPGDQLQYLLDGQLHNTLEANSYTFKTLDRGSHSVTVNLISPTNKTLKTSSSAFTLHRPSVRPISIN